MFVTQRSCTASPLLLLSLAVSSPRSISPQNFICFAFDFHGDLLRPELELLLCLLMSLASLWMSVRPASSLPVLSVDSLLAITILSLKRNSVQKRSWVWYWYPLPGADTTVAGGSGVSRTSMQSTKYRRLLMSMSWP